ncbi:hypothetical protein MVEN_02149000 [Mycena venus]|uniref:Uncharacterized protein n=1 Tax=Mycena venus TaxID=2733690 RepID=A0A8H6XAV0_9AGAR|nr:hypothetical protein MVEN_02149000 [Mycena venus]
MSRYYQPYFRRARPIISGGNRDDNAAEEQRLTRAFHELQDLNGRDGKLCTYIHETSSWKEVPRPQRVGASGKAVDIAASGLVKIWGKYSSPIFCPHTRRSGLAYEPLVITLSEKYEGGIADFLRAVDHQCSFKVVIPPIKPRKILLTWEDRRQHMAEQEGEGQEDDDDNGNQDSQDQPSSSISSISSLSSQSSTSSIHSFGSSSSSASLIARLAVEAIVMPHPRSGQITADPFLVRKPTPIAAGTLLEGSPTKSFYNRKVADARKNSDIETMEFIHQISASGLLEEDPTCHPAWNPDDPPIVLQLYDNRIYTHCLERTNNSLDFLYRPLGQVIRDMNSVLGVPYADYATLIRSTVPCAGCLNHFSPDGYKHHRHNGLCTNHPDLVPIEACEPFNGSIRFRSFRDDKRPEFRGETIDKPIGAALLEWNSRLGVPADVWIMDIRPAQVFHPDLQALVDV